MQLQMTGLSELVAKLEKARIEMAGPGMKKAFRKGGNVIKKAMEERAPVLDQKTASSTASEPGALKAGMRVYLPNDEAEVTALIGPSAKVERVARWVEYGHRMVTGGYSKVTPTGTRGPGTAAEIDVPEHPFLRPAYEESIAEAESVISQSLKESYAEVLS